MTAFTGNNQHALDRARWRVKFRESLLEAHRLTTKNGEEWFLKEEELMEWVDAAKLLVVRLESQQ